MRVTWQIRGLFSPEGEKDFRALVAENLPAIKVVDVNVPNAEATFEFDPAVAFDPRFRDVKPDAARGKLEEANKRATAQDMRTMLEDEFFRDHIQFNQPGAQAPAAAAAPAASPAAAQDAD